MRRGAHKPRIPLEEVPRERRLGRGAQEPLPLPGHGLEEHVRQVHDALLVRYAVWAGAAHGLPVLYDYTIRYELVLISDPRSLQNNTQDKRPTLVKSGSVATMKTRQDR